MVSEYSIHVYKMMGCFALCYLAFSFSLPVDETNWYTISLSVSGEEGSQSKEL